MKKKFRYATDQMLFGDSDYWQDPDEMLARRKGDCEDYALFAQAVLSRNGYSTFLLGLYAQDHAHTVLVFEKAGTWGIFDLDKLRLFRADSLAELASQVAGDWVYLGIMRKEGRTGLISRKFSPAFAKDFFLGDLLAFSSPRG